jgi:hypothetical protein
MSSTLILTAEELTGAAFRAEPEKELGATKAEAMPTVARAATHAVFIVAKRWLVLKAYEA